MYNITDKIESKDIEILYELDKNSRCHHSYEQ